mmetsp:Transcript_65274/g.182549  ORF Transcript_65274/g.182549 Transcript_65274/m.182549 type:complete len:220 (-) Transcript_65274:11-670(-)
MFGCVQRSRLCPVLAGAKPLRLISRTPRGCDTAQGCGDSVGLLHPDGASESPSLPFPLPSQRTFRMRGLCSVTKNARMAPEMAQVPATSTSLPIHVIPHSPIGADAATTGTSAGGPSSVSLPESMKTKGAWWRCGFSSGNGGGGGIVLNCSPESEGPGPGVGFASFGLPNGITGASDGGRGGAPPGGTLTGRIASGLPVGRADDDGGNVEAAGPTACRS